jgi:hypothetical protein
MDKAVLYHAFHQDQSANRPAAKGCQYRATTDPRDELKVKVKTYGGHWSMKKKRELSWPAQT